MKPTYLTTPTAWSKQKAAQFGTTTSLLRIYFVISLSVFSYTSIFCPTELDVHIITESTPNVSL